MAEPDFTFKMGEDIKLKFDDSDDGFNFLYRVGDMSDEQDVTPPGVELLAELIVPSNQRTFNIDITPYKSEYDIIFCYANVTLTASDWLYVVRNGSSASGGQYSNGAFTTTYGVVFTYLPMFGYRTRRISTNFQQSTAASSSADTNNYFLYTYKSEVNIKAGSKFRVYGMKLSNLEAL